ncbi:cytokine-dependent hematopoietic cell linker isoform X1 [Oryzias latipes]|uniref:SH2 domain-containing protein n=2 Tax=Oryzias latipes TaxID=8090 RepID=A0A3B3H4W9_ORYLA|nr:cytokine-dependent hematopoietic cell linker isoform X1 [Oryzias latipes]
MSRITIDMNSGQPCANTNTDEPEYDVVDDHETMCNVHILPARPIIDEREYADRDLPRSASSQNFSCVSTNHPRCLSRNFPRVPGPAVNRDLKPTKRKNKSKTTPPPPPPEDQISPRFAQSPTPSVQEMIDRLTVHTIIEEDLHLRRTECADSESRTRGRQRAESLSGASNNQRHSLDLETRDLEKGSQQNIERVPSRRHHHEWPQTKDDIHQHDFIPIQKPQTYCEGDWYVGACKRTDAEHALHLVNKDGAFLVRDCSTTSNSEPLVLVVYHEKKVYNVKIRYIESINKYALGTGQRSNDVFDSVAQIINFHSIFPIIFISGRNVTGTKYPDNCVLTCPITKQDLDHLLQ